MLDALLWFGLYPEEWKMCYRQYTNLLYINLLINYWGYILNKLNVRNIRVNYPFRLKYCRVYSMGFNPVGLTWREHFKG